MHTTIAIDHDLKEDLRRFGRKGKNYANILRRLLREVKEHEIESLLMDETDTVPIEDAIEEARRWRARSSPERSRIASSNHSEEKRNLFSRRCIVSDEHRRAGRH